ncbi:GH19632, partial [Drosophila grimshawi]
PSNEISKELSVEQPSSEITKETPAEEPSNEIITNETTEGVISKVEGSDNQVVKKAQAKGRSHSGGSYPNGLNYPDEFYIIDSNAVTPSPELPNNEDTVAPVKSSHPFHSIKPAHLSMPPHPFFFIPFGSSGPSGLSNKHGGGTGSGTGTGSGSGTMSKPGYITIGYNPNNNNNKNGLPFNSNTTPDQSQSKPGFFSIPFSGFNSKSNPNDQLNSNNNNKLPYSGQEQQQALQLIGHIFIYKTTDTGSLQKGDKGGNPRPASSTTSDDEQQNKSEDSTSKMDEKIGHSQLLLQPVIYSTPSNNKNDNKNKNQAEGNFNPNHIEEIFRSLQLVQPSVQQRSQSAVASEDNAVLFAVEIPKPIYRFFKSVFGVFSQ